MEKKSKFESVSCIVIAYNEQETIREAIEGVLSELRSFNFKEIEVLVVDDASTDDTNSIASELASKNPEIRIIRHEKNLGPGSGIKTGIINSKNEVICFHAADNQLDFTEVASHIPKLDEYDLLIGQRTARPGYTVARHFVSKVSIGLVNLFFGLKYKDYNFLYLYRRSIFEKMKLKSSGIFVVTEILIKAIDNGAEVGEITVGCKPRLHGKASCGKPSIILKTFCELMSFWLSYRLLGRK